MQILKGVNKYISILFAIMMLSSIALLSIADGRSSVIYPENGQDIRENHYSGMKASSSDEDFNMDPYLEEKEIFDEELYRKQLDSVYNSSMLFAAFSAHAAALLYLLLKRIRRGKFEETQFIHILILMDYIHQVDGEWACSPSLTARYA